MVNQAQNPSEHIGNRADASLLIALAREAAANASRMHMDGAAAEALSVVSQLTQMENSGKIDPSALAFMASAVTTLPDPGPAKGTDDTTADDTAKARTQALVVATAASRIELDSLEDRVYNQNIYRDQLKFRDKHDEDDYYERARQNRAQIEVEKAKGTPEGDLNANGIMLHQLNDAQKHGADVTKEWDELAKSTLALRHSMVENGMSTEKFDAHLKAYVVDFLKDKGKSQEEIDALFANPNKKELLETVRSLIGDDKDSKDLIKDVIKADDINKAKAAAKSQDAVVANTKASVKDSVPAASPNSTGDAILSAKLAAAGLPALDATTETGHGLTIQKPATKDSSLSLAG